MNTFLPTIGYLDQNGSRQGVASFHFRKKEIQCFLLALLHSQSPCPGSKAGATLWSHLKPSSIPQLLVPRRKGQGKISTLKLQRCIFFFFLHLCFCNPCIWIIMWCEGIHFWQNEYSVIDSWLSVKFTRNYWGIVSFWTCATHTTLGQILQFSGQHFYETLWRGLLFPAFLFCCFNFSWFWSRYYSASAHQTLLLRLFVQYDSLMMVSDQLVFQFL